MRHGARHDQLGGPGRGAGDPGVTLAAALARPSRAPGQLGILDSRPWRPAVSDREHGGALGRRREARVAVAEEFVARLWSDGVALAVLPVVNLSTHGMLLGAGQRVPVDVVSVELIGRMWRFLGRARVVGRAQPGVRLDVIAWDGRARERIQELVSVRMLAGAT